MFKLEIYSGQKRKPAKDANKVKHVSSDLQVKLDELRKEISSSHGAFFLTQFYPLNKLTC